MMEIFTNIYKILSHGVSIEEDGQEEGCVVEASEFGTAGGLDEG